MSLTRLSSLKSLIPINRCFIRNISTSKKKSDTATVVNPDITSETKVSSKNWVSYGFSHKSEGEDRAYLHLLMFTCISLACVGIGFGLAYRPDDIGRDWAQREGYLELRRREKLGLPLIDPNYIPLSQLKVPDDEELGDTEIII